MLDTIGRTEPALHRLADRSARLGHRVLRASAMLAVVGGALFSSTWTAGSASTLDTPIPCASPPCLGWDGLPPPERLAEMLSMLGYLSALALSVPSALVAATFLTRRHWRSAAPWLVPPVGLLLFLVGMEVLPHLLSPCLSADVRNSPTGATLCEGRDVHDRFHLLSHTLVGAVPLGLLYRRTWQRVHDAPERSS